MIKAYIFDQDGTLYHKNSKLTKELRERTKRWISESLGLAREEVDSIYERLPEKFPHPYHGFLSLGLSPEEYHKEVFDRIEPALYLGNDKRLIDLFSDIIMPKYVVTFASLSYSKQLQQKLGIFDLVELTISSIGHPPTYSKAKAYNLIKENLRTSADEICVIGDNFSTDILPAVENGFQAIFLNNIKKSSDDKIRVINNIYDLEGLIL